jgi:hypothetical protein
MAKYKVIVSKHVAEHLLEHVRFISNVSLVAARNFISEYESILNRLENNPFEFQIDTSFDNPDEYRRAVFSKWYKCIFLIKGSTVYIDSVIDCRQDKP